MGEGVTMLQPAIAMTDEFSAFEDLFKKDFGPEITVDAHDLLYGSKEKAEQVCLYIVSGWGEACLLHENGEKSQLFMRGPGTIVPLYYSFSNTVSQNILLVEAVEECKVLRMPKIQFKKLLFDHASLAMAMIDAYGKFTNSLDYMMLSRAKDPLETRVCDFLNLNMESDGSIHMTQEQMASSLGASRPKINAVISQLKNAGIVEAKRGTIHVSDPKILSSFCSFSARQV